MRGSLRDEVLWTSLNLERPGHIRVAGAVIASGREIFESFWHDAFEEPHTTFLADNVWGADSEDPREHRGSAHPSASRLILFTITRGSAS